MGVLSFVLDILFPPKCVFCQKLLPFGEHGLCQKCADETEMLNTPVRGDFFLKCYAPFAYDGNIRRAFLRFKFEGRKDYAPLFGNLMARCAEENLSQQYDLLTFVPVSKERRKERGYDQTELLATEMGKILGAEPVSTLEKRVNNPQQSSLKDRKLRTKNVKNVYVVCNKEAVRNRRILLVDDIITTGSTLEETAKLLLKSGALSVVCIAFAQPKK